jgi:hypothetical protein
MSVSKALATPKPLKALKALEVQRMVQLQLPLTLVLYKLRWRTPVLSVRWDLQL